MLNIILAIIIALAGLAAGIFFGNAKRSLERDPESGVAKR